jgi:hypothetical protein
MSGALYSCVLMSCSGNSANAFSFYKVVELPASIHRIGKQIRKELKGFQFSGHEPIYFIENKEKTLQASYDRDTQLGDYMD